MTSTQQQVIGKAVYLEFRRTNPTGASATTQILITPEADGIATTTSGSAPAVVQLAMFRRRISSYQPRKTWRFIAAGKSSRTVAPTATSVNAAALSLIDFTNRTFEALASEGWKLFKDPIVVEVTKDDMQSVRLGKTPYKVLGRVWKSRKFLGFPAEFYEKPMA